MNSSQQGTEVVIFLSDVILQLRIRVFSGILYVRRHKIQNSDATGFIILCRGSLNKLKS